MCMHGRKSIFPGYFRFFFHLSAANVAQTTGAGFTQPSRLSGPESGVTVDIGATGSSSPILSKFTRVILRSPWCFQYHT